jgi:hypothetical protein
MSMIHTKLIRAIAFSVLAGLPLCAPAQDRTIPANAKRGEIRQIEGMLVEINGTRVLLPPGVQIRDAANRGIVPTAIPPGAQIRYLVNQQGVPTRIWLLTPEEAAKSAPGN